MKRLQVFICSILLLAIGSGSFQKPIQAQDGGLDIPATLELIQVAYASTIELDNYVIEWDDETNQTITFNQDSNKLIFESEEVIERDMERSAGDYQITFTQSINQNQTVNNGEAIGSEVEFNLKLTRENENTWLNVTSTDSQFRPGLPEYWHILDETVQLPQDVEITIDELIAFTDVQLDENLLLFLTPEVVIAIEDDGLRSGNQRYNLTLDLAQALVVQGIDVIDLVGDLPPEIATSILEHATYTLHVRVEEDTNRIVRYEIELAFDVTIPAGTLSGDFADTALNINFEQSQVVALDKFDELFVIKAPYPFAEYFGN